MIGIDRENIVDYLRSRAMLQPAEAAEVIELGGGVSNMVFRIETAERHFVLKQSLARLRVREDWFSNLDRIFRESGGMTALGNRLDNGRVPEVLFEDPENFVILISAAPSHARNYKTCLLRGEVEHQTARQAGLLLAEIHKKTFDDAAIRKRFIDDECFHQLRVDPYYRWTQKKHPDISDKIEDIVQDMLRRKITLVHGDYSPKNILLYDDTMMLLDFEVVHYGDPAFDVGFFLSHLILKSIKNVHERETYFTTIYFFWNAYRNALPSFFYPEMEQNIICQLGCCLLARMDGKSTVEYIKDEPTRAVVRKIAKRILTAPEAEFGDTMTKIKEMVETECV